MNTKLCNQRCRVLLIYSTRKLTYVSVLHIFLLNWKYRVQEYGLCYVMWPTDNLFPNYCCISFVFCCPVAAFFINTSPFAYESWLPLTFMLTIDVEGRRFPSAFNKNVFVFCHAHSSWQQHYFSLVFQPFFYLKNIFLHVSNGREQCLVFYSLESALVTIFVIVSMFGRC